MAVPSDLSGLVFWVKADDAANITESGGEVSQWNDKSGAGNHVTQTTAGSKPKTGLSTINGKNVITFDSTDSIFRTSTSICANGFTVFTVSKRTAQDDYNCAPISIGYSNQGRPIDFYGASRFVDHSNIVTSGGWDNLGSDTTPTIRVHTGAPSSPYKERKNTSAEKTSTANIAAGAFYIFGQKITLGTRGDGVTRFIGDIAEEVVYDRILTAGEIDSIYAYLSAEWLAVSGTGTGSVTLGTLSQTAAGVLELKASSAKTLGAMTASSAGTIAISGDSAKALGALTQTATTKLEIQATASQTLGQLTATGYSEIVGQDNQGSGEVVLQRKRVYIKRGKQYLIFNTHAEADAYAAAEEAIETAKKSSRGAARRKAKALKVPSPEVVQAVEPEKLEAMLARFSLKFDLVTPLKNDDFAALHYIQEQLAILQDDEDIELLLLTL